MTKIHRHTTEDLLVQCRDLVDQITNLKINIVDEDNVTTLAYSLTNFKDEGKNLFNQVCLHQTLYDTKYLNNLWKEAIIKSKKKPDSFIRACREKGIKTGELNGQIAIIKIARLKKIEKWLDEHYEFKKNTISSEVFAREKGGAWEICNEKEIWRTLQHNLPAIGAGKIPFSDIINLLDSKFVPEFNPIQDYFAKLPPWSDGIDHIDNLAGYVTTTNQKYWRKQFKKALVRMIACSIGGIVNRIVMTLVGEVQESGKSTFIRFLCPAELRSHYKEEPMLHDKDSEIALAENFIWNLEELDDLNRQQISAMKAIISRESIKQRRAYTRHEKIMRRIVNFWGSTNKQDFLTDTQNTRWICFEVIGIDHNYHNTKTRIKKIDINKVWAQAYVLYLSGFDYQLDNDDRIERDQANRDFETMPEEKQHIIQFFEVCKPGAVGSKFMMNVEIKEHLNNNTSKKNFFNELNIGRSMTQLGFIREIKKKNGVTVRGYWVKKIAENQQEKDQFYGDVELPF